MTMCNECTCVALHCYNKNLRKNKDRGYLMSQNINNVNLVRREKQIKSALIDALRVLHGKLISHEWRCSHISVIRGSARHMC